ncbi:MAG: hypothetical protein HFG28_09910 [Eubacterium sp.]|nr:hypothetical protein [Eubacterium sp.]
MLKIALIILLITIATFVCTLNVYFLLKMPHMADAKKIIIKTKFLKISIHK